MTDLFCAAGHQLCECVRACVCKMCGVIDYFVVKHAHTFLYLASATHKIADVEMRESSASYVNHRTTATERGTVVFRPFHFISLALKTTTSTTMANMHTAQNVSAGAPPMRQMFIALAHAAQHANRRLGTASTIQFTSILHNRLYTALCVGGKINKKNVSERRRRQPHDDKRPAL